ncbi:MAG: hypothetical protein QXU82_00560 [Candidatus Aenigmatarchaeota archaeon]
MISENEREVLEIVRQKGLMKKSELGEKASVAKSLKEKGYLGKVVFGEEAFVLTGAGSRALFAAQQKSS